MTLTKNQAEAIRKIQENQPVAEEDVTKVIGKGARRTLDQLRAKGAVKRNRRGRGGPFIVTDAGIGMLHQS